MSGAVKRKLGCGLMAVGLLLLLGSASLLGYNLWQANQAGETAEIVLAEVKAASPEPSPATETPQSQSLVSQAEPTVEDEPMKEVEIDGKSYIGWISIPDLDLELPVMSQWSYPNLKLSPCRYSGTASQGNLIILAHNYPRHFGNLKSLAAGSSVIFTDVEGSEYHYQVAEIQTLQGTDLDALEEEGDWDLTLFTCTVGGQYRVTVRCVAEE